MVVATAIHLIQMKTMSTEIRWAQMRVMCLEMSLVGATAFHWVEAKVMSLELSLDDSTSIRWVRMRATMKDLSLAGLKMMQIRLLHNSHQCVGEHNL